MRRWWVLFGLMILLISSTARSTLAATETVTLPPVTQVATLHQTVFLEFNGQPLQVCQIDFSSAVRLHGTCQDFQTVPIAVPGYQTDLVTGQVTEFIEYDGTSYTRINAETTWTSKPIEDYDPTVSVIDLLSFPFASVPGVLSQVGSTTVGATPATQYQYWVTDSEWNSASGGQFVYDIFISSDGRMVKDQGSYRGTLPQLGTGELQLIFGYSDYNAPITVSPPPASQVQ